MRQQPHFYRPFLCTIRPSVLLPSFLLSRGSNGMNGVLSKESVIEQQRTLSTVRGPAWRNSEIPILEVLLESPDGACRTKDALRKVKKRYNFSERDLAGRYAISQQRVIDTIIKFGRKNLVEKREVYPSGGNCLVGVWKITPKGAERVLRERASWTPKYTHYRTGSTPRSAVQYCTASPQKGRE